MKTKSLLLSATFALLTGTSVSAQPLFSFESGLDGWAVSGFNARPVTLATSAIGATHGSQALAITQMGAGFSWNAKRDNAGMDAFYNAMNVAALNESLWMLELDVTYRDASIPDDPGLTFLNLSLWINSNNGFRDIHSQAFTPGHEDKTIHLTIPLTNFSGDDELNPNATFYQLGIGMNGNWGTGDATVYFDNIQLTLVPEPSTLALLALGSLWGLSAWLRRRNRVGQALTHRHTV
jgi:hypothetical protein